MVPKERVKIPSFPLHCRVTKRTNAVGLRGVAILVRDSLGLAVGLRDCKNLPPNSQTMELSDRLVCWHGHTVGRCSLSIPT